MPSVVPQTFQSNTRGNDMRGKEQQLTHKPNSSLSIMSFGGSILPGPPLFSAHEKKRRWMLEHMAGAFRMFARKGYSEGIAGHISLRDPERRDCFWTNPLGVHFGLISVSDLILVNEAGNPVGGNISQPVNAAGFQIHSHLHKRYPHVNAACHTHSKNGRAWSTFGRRLDMINQDACTFYGTAHNVYEDFRGIVLDEKEGGMLADALGDDGKGLILQNHGLLTVGKTVDEAAYLYTLMEGLCEIQLKVEAVAARGPAKILISDEAASFTCNLSGDSDSLYAEFQPDFQLELRLSEDDFLH